MLAGDEAHDNVWRQGGHCTSALHSLGKTYEWGPAGRLVVVGARRGASLPCIQRRQGPREPLTHAHGAPPSEGFA